MNLVRPSGGSRKLSWQIYHSPPSSDDQPLCRYLLLLLRISYSWISVMDSSPSNSDEFIGLVLWTLLPQTAMNSLD